IFLFGLGLLMLRGLVMIEPNESKAVLLFGRYRGTLRKTGFHWVNPFSGFRHVSLRARNFDSTKLKVNDQRGNPVEIGAVVVGRAKGTAKAQDDVDASEPYETGQTESAIRTSAAKNPYDWAHDGGVTMGGGSAEVSAGRMAQLSE